MTQLSGRAKNTLYRPRGAVSVNIELMMQNASLDERPSDTPRFLRRSTAVLAAMRSLPTQGLLVLFTPLVPPHPSDADSEGPPMDPFEPFGRALAKHHKRVRHVPYVPSMGMTKTHLAFLSHASAVVVVSCGSGTGSTEPTRKDKDAGFARAVLKAVAKPDKDVPTVLVLVACGQDAAASIPEAKDAATVVHAPSYEAGNLRHVAELVFGG